MNRSHLACLAVVVALFMLVADVSAREDYSLAITRVSDGDTVKGRKIGGQGKRNAYIRLYGIDAPEMEGHHWKTQPGARASSAFLRAMLPVGEIVQVTLTGVDDYKRELAVLTMQDGRVVQDELLRAGHAWVYTWFCTDKNYCDRWRALEAEARAARRGLWRDGKATAPWHWRKRHNAR